MLAAAQIALLPPPPPENPYLPDSAMPPQAFIPPPSPYYPSYPPEYVPGGYPPPLPPGYPGYPPPYPVAPPVQSTVPPPNQHAAHAPFLSPVGGSDQAGAPQGYEKLSTDERMYRILDFWFGNLPGPDYFPEDKMPIWLANTPEIDRQIRILFNQDMLNAEKGIYNQWRNSPRGRLALILLLDQMPRAVYRNKPQAYVLDRMARTVALEGIQKGDDKELLPIERAFFYLPLQHSEDVELQDLSVALYRNLVYQTPEAIRPQMLDILQAAVMHQQQIYRFGRFPQRNAILNRESSPKKPFF